MLASGFWTTLRTDGMTGDSRHDLAWRWTETAEARLLATTTDERLAPRPKRTKTANDEDWPGFRGRNRDSIVRGSRIATDWDTSPPEELWRRPVGPGVGLFLGPGASGLHPGATGRSGDGLELSGGDRRAGLATRRPGYDSGTRTPAPGSAAPRRWRAIGSMRWVARDG